MEELEVQEERLHGCVFWSLLENRGSSYQMNQ